jgi:hypothetical protein
MVSLRLALGGLCCVYEICLKIPTQPDPMIKQCTRSHRWKIPLTGQPNVRKVMFRICEGVDKAGDMEKWTHLQTPFIRDNIEPQVLPETKVILPTAIC